MRVVICGNDGYIGAVLTEYLTKCGYKVFGFDSYRRRNSVESLIPIARPKVNPLDIRDTEKLRKFLRETKPDVIYHLAEEASAPYSMKNVWTAMETQTHNIAGVLSLLYAAGNECRKAHIIKLGSMGEYIPSSWYHLSKVHDSKNMRWACEAFGFRVTDVFQGPVYGIGGRFDYDEFWGTVINRFLTQALVKAPLTIYGDGEQKRGFLPIQDSLQCLRIIAENPPERGEYRIVNQYAERLRIKEIAELVSRMTGAEISNIYPNPRAEQNDYPGDANNHWLLAHGYYPYGNLITNLEELWEELQPYKQRVRAMEDIKVRWGSEL